jgi:hypothetical protein
MWLGPCSPDLLVSLAGLQDFLSLVFVLAHFYIKTLFSEFADIINEI